MLAFEFGGQRLVSNFGQRIANRARIAVMMMMMVIVTAVMSHSMHMRFAITTARVLVAVQQTGHADGERVAHQQQPS